MVLSALDAAGMEIMVANLTRGLARRGHEVGVTCLDAGGSVADELEAGGVRVEVVPTPGFRSILRPVRLAAWLRHLRPDVVHVHSGGWLRGARAAARVGLRVLHTMHGFLEDEPWHAALLDRWAARYTDRVVAVAETLRQYLVGRVGLAAAKTTVIPNGIDADFFTPGRRRPGWRASLGVRDGAFVIGNVARLASVKNHAQLLDAFALVRQQGLDVVLAIAGEGPLRPALEAQALALGLRDDIRFLGETRDVAALYREFDVFALSSRSEGTSISLLEAMASGVCVVATAVGGTPKLLGEGRYGRLVPAGDAGALAAGLAALLRDDEERRRLAVAARREVLAKYSLDAMLTAYECEYEQVTRFGRVRLEAGVS
jgi:glycosyltransferase involved in cell wall biosynthesis